MRSSPPMPAEEMLRRRDGVWEMAGADANKLCREPDDSSSSFGLGRSLEKSNDEREPMGNEDVRVSVLKKHRYGIHVLIQLFLYLARFKADFK